MKFIKHRAKTRTFVQEIFKIYLHRYTLRDKIKPVNHNKNFDFIRSDHHEQYPS